MMHQARIGIGMGIFGASLLLSACDKPAEQRNQASDDRDIAMVQKAQQVHAPVQRVVLEPVTHNDPLGADLDGAGCAFIAGAPEQETVLLLNDAVAALKLDGQIERFAVDAGSPQLQAGPHAHYVGKRYSLRLTQMPGEAVTSGEESARWQARLDIADEFDRGVYSADGALECGA